MNFYTHSLYYIIIVCHQRQNLQVLPEGLIFVVFPYNVVVLSGSLIQGARVEGTVVSCIHLPVSMEVIGHDTDEVQLADGKQWETLPEHIIDLLVKYRPRCKLGEVKHKQK